MKFNIQNIPLPASRPNTLTATMRALNVGQSFLIPNDEIKQNTQKGLYTIAINVGIVVTTRTVDDGLRVWRVDPHEISRAEIIEDELPMDRNEKIANLKMLQDAVMLGQNPLKQGTPLTDIFPNGIHASAGGEIYTEPAEWRFTSDKPEYHDSGDIYRQQYLVSNPKKRRSVRVDADNHDTILRV